MVNQQEADSWRGGGGSIQPSLANSLFEEMASYIGVHHFLEALELVGPGIAEKQTGLLFPHSRLV